MTDIDKEKERMEDAVSSVQYKLQDVLDWLNDQLDRLGECKKEATEEAFDVLLKNGFNVFTRFTCGADSKTVWTITGITNEGFRCKAVVNGETKSTILPADSKERVEKYLPNLKIVNLELSTGDM